MRKLLRAFRERFHPLYKLRQKRWFRSLQERLDFTRMCKVPGIRHRVALRAFRDASYWSLGFHFEEGIEKATTALMPEGQGSIWDVGANVGMWTWSALALRPELSAVLLEPDETNARLIRMTADRARFHNVKLEMKAVSEEEGVLEFVLDDASGKTGQVASLYEENPDRTVGGAYGLSKKVQVEATTLDALRTKYGRGPDLLKIDVEGAEDLVLRGGKNVLSEDQPAILIEAFEGGEALSLLRSHGYRLFVIEPGNYAATTPHRVAQLSRLEALGFKELRAG